MRRRGLHGKGKKKVRSGPVRSGPVRSGPIVAASVVLPEQLKVGVLGELGSRRGARGGGRRFYEPEQNLYSAK